MIRVERTGSKNPALDFSAKSKRISPAIAREVLRLAQFGGGEIAREIIRTDKHGTGTLAKSFLPARFMKTARNEVSAAAASDLVYARIQNDGGVIRPRISKYLMIPIKSGDKLQYALKKSVTLRPRRFIEAAKKAVVQMARSGVKNALNLAVSK